MTIILQTLLFLAAINPPMEMEDQMLWFFGAEMPVCRPALMKLEVAVAEDCMWVMQGNMET